MMTGQKQDLEFLTPELDVEALLRDAIIERLDLLREILPDYETTAFRGLQRLGLYQGGKWCAEAEPEKLNHPPVGSQSTKLEISIGNLFNVLGEAVVELSDCPLALQRPQRTNVWVQHGDSYIEQRCKPDLVLVRKDIGIGSRPIQWKDILTACEVKYSDSRDNVASAEKQLHDISFFVLSSQIQRIAFLGFTVCGTTLRLYLFARKRCYKSLPIDLHSNPVQLMRLLAITSMGSPGWLGYDATYASGTIMGLTTRFEGSWYRVIRILCQAKGINSRGTRVVLVQLANNPRAPMMIIKDTSYALNSATDGDIHRLLQDSSLQGIPMDPETKGLLVDLVTKLYGGKEACVLTEPPLSGRRNLPGIPIFLGEEVLPLCRIEHVALKQLSNSPVDQKRARSAYGTSATGIMWFSCVREFLDAVIGAVVAHALGYFTSGILHGDVSDTNVWLKIDPNSFIGGSSGLPALNQALVAAVAPFKPNDAPDDWYPKREGVLGDWGFAQNKSARVTEDVRYLTGTFPFQSVELLEAEQAEHFGRRWPEQRVHHDLESFFWVLWIICINCVGPFNQRAQWSDYPSATLEKDPDRQRLSLLPSWARPGPCDIRPMTVAHQKRLYLSSSPELTRVMSDYFLQHFAITRGMKELSKLFAWQDTSPPPDVTHLQVLRILLTMRDGIDPRKDPYPSVKVVEEARQRFVQNLAKNMVETSILGTGSSVTPSIKRTSRISKAQEKLDSEVSGISSQQEQRSAQELGPGPSTESPRKRQRVG